MQVRAIERGYFGGKLREPGELFSLAEVGQFSRTWMEPVAWEPDHPVPGRPLGDHDKRRGR